MYIAFTVIGVVILAALIWAFYALPKDDPSSNDDEDGGTHTGGDGYPVDTPPSIIVNVPDQDRAPRSPTNV